MRFENAKCPECGSKVETLFDHLDFWNPNSPIRGTSKLHIRCTNPKCTHDRVILQTRGITIDEAEELFFERERQLVKAGM